MCTLKGIHTFRRDHNTQTSMCKPWGMQVRPFLSLRKKMKDYIEERQTILNPFPPNKEFPNRPVPSPFIKRSKSTPTKRSHTESRHDIKKPGKGNKRCFQYHGSINVRAAETVPQIPVLIQPAVPIFQAPTEGIYAQPVTATAPTQPMTTIPRPPHLSQNCCALCMPVGRQCQNNYMLPMHPEWSDPEEEKDLSKQESEGEQEKEEDEDWDSTRQKETE